MNAKTRGLIECHIAVFILGFTALFAKGIALPAPIIIFGRSVVSAICLLAGILFFKSSIRIRSKGDILTFIILGALLCGHWVTYFHSVQVSTVAIGLISLFTFPIMTIFLEPLFSQEKLKLMDVLSGIAVLVGIIIIVPEFSLSNHDTQGILWGLLSALMYSFRNIYSRRFLSHYPSTFLMGIQSSVSAVILGVALGSRAWLAFSAEHIITIIALGAIFTAISHTLFMKSFTHLGTASASIISSIQPVYGSVWAIILFNEIPSLNTVIGGSIILALVIIETIKHKSS